MIKTFYELLDGKKEKTAIFYKDEKISYKQLKEKIEERCDELKDIVSKRDKIIIKVSNTPKAIIDIYAIDKLGCVIIPVNPLATEKEIKEITEDVKANIIISENEIKRISDEKINNLPEDASLIFYTSGTTGKPKIIIHTKESIITPCYEEGKVYGIKENDIIGGTPSLSFTYGFGAFAIIPFLFGASVSLFIQRILIDNADPPIKSVVQGTKILETIEKHKITVFYSIPTTYRTLLEILLRMPEKYDLNSLRLLVTAGEPMGILLYNKLKNILPKVEILEHLGCTESFHAIVSNTPKNIRPGSIGKEIPCYKVKIFDENGDECLPNVKGNFAYKGPSGKYLKKTEENEWMFTGDIAYKDEEGYFWFVSRNDDLIKTAGYLVSPHEIENILMEHQAVLEVAVVGIPDPWINQRIKAFIVLKDGFKPSDKLKDTLIKFLVPLLPEYKIPSEIEFVDSIPKNKRGKILRKRLRS